MDKLEERPKYCGECKYIQKTVETDCCVFDGDSPYYCTQARLKVYRNEKACPWGLIKEHQSLS